MFASYRNFLCKAVAESALAIALLGTAAVTSDQAAATATRSASAAPAPARSALELQALILRDCRDIDYGRVDGFEGMLSDFVCGA
jgi:hypothetical protein